MQWQFIVAIVIAIPIILFPAAFVWYLNIGGIYHVVREAVRKRRAVREERRRAVAQAERHIAVAATEQTVEREAARTKH